MTCLVRISRRKGDRSPVPMAEEQVSGDQFSFGSHHRSQKDDQGQVKNLHAGVE